MTKAIMVMAAMKSTALVVINDGSDDVRVSDDDGNDEDNSGNGGDNSAYDGDNGSSDGDSNVGSD